MQEPGFLQPRGVSFIKWCLQGLPAIRSCAATRAEGTSSLAHLAPGQGQHLLHPLVGPRACWQPHVVPPCLTVAAGSSLLRQGNVT